jgi:hypothetical protein
MPALVGIAPGTTSSFATLSILSSTGKSDAPDVMDKPDTPEKPAARRMHRSAIADLAYQYWQERGCPIGSPYEDWYRAERELQKVTATRNST